MSLRLRLIALIALTLAASLAGGGVLAWRHGVGSVGTEMAAALSVGRETLTTILGDDAPDDRRVLAAFEGDRHLRARLLDADGHETAASTLANPDDPPPDWFRAFFATPVHTYRANLSDGSTILLETDDRNEIGELWGEFSDGVLTLALFVLPTLLFVYWAVGRALAPLGRLAMGFRAIGEGHYDTRVVPGGPPELARLGADFNRMAAFLAALQGQTERLNAQLQTLQEEERTDLARDLHDEIGPSLFAMSLDLAAIAQVAGPGAVDRIDALRQAIHQVQRQVRDILARLRPAALVEVGLAQAAANLARFWQQRHPEIDIRVQVAPAAELLDEARDEAIYRIVQESLSNALRHAQAKTITIRIEADAEDDAMVLVEDDGSGFADPRPGYGLTGMRERVAALGGQIAVGAGSGGRGTVVSARLPRRVMVT